MKKKELKELLERYKRRECTEQERAYVERWYLNWEPAGLDLSEEELRSDLNAIQSRLPKPQPKFLYYKLAAAAVLLIAMSAVFFFALNNHKLEDENLAFNNPILPGGNKAILTLANGKTIILDTASTGKISTESGIHITKTADGQLIYHVDHTTDLTAIGFNTISTPKGGQYQVFLPDGTHVWLNAASSLRFPVEFSGTERSVQLVGEAYFEVAKNKRKPFRVNTTNQVVEVLGTHFNVNAYPDEKISKTTLLEGKVAVSKGAQVVLLAPGQQALNNAGFSSLNVKKIADVSEAVAWKNGLFMFDNEDIYTIMNKISRWYDVEIVFIKDMKGRTYGGNISRFTDVKEVLNTMELTGTIHFKIEERRIIVMP